MKDLLRGIPEKFGKSYLVSGFLPVAYAISINISVYLLINQEGVNQAAFWKQWVKRYSDIGFAPVFIVGFIIFSLVIYNLRFLSIRILSGNLPFIWTFGRCFQLWKKKRIHKKVFSYLDPFAWVAEGEMKWKLPEIIKKRWMTCHMLLCVNLTIKIMNKISIKPKWLRLPLFCMLEIMRSTKNDDKKINEKKRMHKQFKERINNLYEANGQNLFKDLYNKLQKAQDARYSFAYYDYPIDNAYIMPTLYGNILRCSEAHAKECYGIDQGVVWPHLFEVTSEKYIELLSTTRNNLEAVSQCVVLTILSLIIWFVIILMYKFNFFTIFTILGIGFISYLFYRAAIVSAREYVKAIIGCYDLFQKELLNKLPIMENIESDKVRWKKISHFLHGLKDKHK